ncbi:polysaccharide lyase family 7 protein [Uliginosibacterium sp. TH139]|uniref:polysaccharide lyase family 7 protein n=1 Tax=Uliginosibacterium sp. TH139 TaxID=2067453 RepID=UPI000C7CA573|nr:polysaccharide lyase family 7 protein [Uliginosibacterium sp. TH139]PLK50459.1 hypothetical protein C0V76_01120 [Uliginosibacterium sp. TH139]
MLIAICGPAAAQQALLTTSELRHWKLTLPLDADGDGKADEISRLAGYRNPPWFTPTTEGILFRANAGGARTSGSTAYARAELRELDESGRPAAWDCLGDTRNLKLEQVVLHTTTAKPEATIGQIHDAKNDNLMFKYVGPAGANGSTDTGRIELLWNDAAQSEVLDAAYTLGQPMRVKVAVNKGAVQVTYRNLVSGLEKQVAARLDPTSIVGACFFKVGVYIQACSKLDAYGKPNAVCEKKGWDARRYDAPEAYAEVLIQRIEM